jgi:poly-gamma-glutamate capsule biosynthesis protein CapA/YwtB (metallophosphatase superfamily)
VCGNIKIDSKRAKNGTARLFWLASRESFRSSTFCDDVVQWYRTLRLQLGGTVRIKTAWTSNALTSHN